MEVLVPSHITTEVETALRAISPSVKVLAFDSEHPPPVNEAEILLRYFPNKLYPGLAFDADALRRVVNVSRNLKWIHNGMTGMDGVLYPELAESHIIVSNGSGAQRQVLAQAAIGMMLAWSQCLREHLANQQAHLWQHLPHISVYGKTALILGFGAVGHTIAQICRCLGMRVLGIKRHPSRGPHPAADKIATPEALRHLLPEADFVFITAVLTQETRGVIGEAELQLMRPNAFLINIARGAIIDEPALIRALSNGWIAGAALDVFLNEPLPAASPLWEMPNVFITPHNAGWSSTAQDEALEIFYDNFRRYVSGFSLLNVVNKQLGY